jgi:hypothetical protein
MNDNVVSSIASRSDKLLQETIATIEKFKIEQQCKKLYSFTFVAAPEGTSVSCAFATEEGLTDIATYYVNQRRSGSKVNTIDMERLALRWLNPDEGWHYYFFDDVFNAFWLEPFTNKDLELFDGSTESICMDVLKQLNMMHIFGRGAKRDSIIIGLTYGCDPDDFLKFAQHVNPPIAYGKMCDEIRAGCKISGVESPV